MTDTPEPITILPTRRFVAHNLGMPIHAHKAGKETKTSDQYIWLHGWADDHNIFRGLIDHMDPTASHYVVDFPGFGRADVPPVTWTTYDYADFLAQWLNTLPKAGRRIIIGHSFGGRVQMILAGKIDISVDLMVILAGAGLARTHSPFTKGKITILKTVKKILNMIGISVEGFKRFFGSDDYRRASPVMREVFKNVIQQDLREHANHITCPVKLIYGDQDTICPPDYGKEFLSRMSNATLDILPGVDHYAMLQGQLAQTAKLINDFIKLNTKGRRK